MPELAAPAARPPARARANARVATTPPAHGDVAAFRACLAVVAVAVADDAFLHPEPGVAAADHLVSGLVPLGCSAGLIWGAPRLPRAVRGWLGVAAGALAVTGGVADGLRPAL